MRKVVLFFWILCLCLKASAQDSAKFQISGYVSVLGSERKMISDSLFRPAGVLKSKEALIHNRLNLFWYPRNNLTFSVQVRNRLIYGENYSPGIGRDLENDNGWMQLSKTFYSHGDFLANSTIDRLYVQYTLGKLEVSVGRQRINWSQTFAWNPNDIFNASNYFDFDYPEKPGSDAVRFQYYTGMASSAEAVIKLDNRKNITAAALYKMNVNGYDFQLLGGIMNEEEVVLGGGWSGNLKTVGFRGEITSLFPYKHTSFYRYDLNNLLLAAVSFDYTFPNSARLMSEFLYSSDRTQSVSSMTSLFSETITIRNMAFSQFSSLLSFTYPVHPLVNATLSGMYFHKINGFYAGPNIEVSLTDNLDLSFFWQYFYMYFSQEKPVYLDDLAVSYLFVRLKYNF